MIRDYNDFRNELLKAGFSMAGRSDEGIFALLKNNPLPWHTGDLDFDPCEWRFRVLNEHNDISYSKVFFSKAGFITREWYPYFISVRRGNRNFEEDYSDGKVSQLGKKIYDIIVAHNNLPLHEIKSLIGISQKDKYKFDSALTQLQMKMYLTMCGKQQKVSQTGTEYGWSSTMFCTTELFFGEEVFSQASSISQNTATEKIRKQILSLNPSANEKNIVKFIMG